VSADLVTWIRACLDEDERVAKNTLAEHWTVTENSVWGDDEFDQVCRTSVDEEAVHIARWDPARILAEVAAKRALLAKLDEYAPPWLD
jgi:hypothetical protein